MKKIALIAMFVALEGENRPTRFQYLAEFLSKNGFQVDLITSSFQHWEKKARERVHVSGNNRQAYRIIKIKEPGYGKNVCLSRIRSHRILAENLKKYLEKHEGYDLIYVSIPPNSTAAITAEIAKQKKIPCIVDVEDLWPEAMKMVINIPLLNHVLYHSFVRDAKKVYQNCDAVVGTADSYRDEIDKYARRNIPRETVYVGNEIMRFDKGIQEYQTSIEKPEDEFWVMYTGTIGASYDLKTLIEAAAMLQNSGYGNIKVKILGLGPEKERLERYAEKITGNVEFAGYVPFEKMAAYLSKSDMTINSLKKKAPQSIVTKIADYLAAGKPMINTGTDEEFRNKVLSDGFGINVEAESAGKLASAILKLYQNPKHRQKMGKHARKIAEEQFDRPQAYQKIINLINHTMESYEG